MRPVLAEQQRLGPASAGSTSPTPCARGSSRTSASTVKVISCCPVVLRAPEAQRHDVESINQLQIWSPSAQRMIPLRQVVEGFETLRRRDHHPARPQAHANV